RFPRHASASQGRVRRGLAQLRLVLQTSRDGPRCLTTAQAILADIDEEAAFPEARAELAALLPQIAEGLAKQAQSSTDAKETRTYVGLTTDALSLVTNSNYVPKSLFPQDRVTNIRATLNDVQRKLNRVQDLHETLAQIEQAVAAGNPQEAYAVQIALLRTYPTLAGDSALQQAVQTIVQAEQVSVHRVDQVQTATQEDPLPVSVAVAVRRKSSGAGPPTGPVLAKLQGAVYGIDAGSGSLLWRRSVGFDPRIMPRLLGTSGDVLLVHANDGALLRVDRATGAMRWRLVLGERLMTPQVSEETVLVSARSGKIFSIDSRTGESAGFVALPQTIATPAALHPSKPVLYQLANHSTLFVLSRDELACLEVVYLGHRTGSIEVPPVVVLDRYLVVAENRGRETAILHLLATDENGRNLRKVQQVRLEGHVVTPPTVAGRLLVAATDRGQVKLFQLGAPGEKDPLVEIAQHSSVDKQPLVRHVLIEDSHLWLAGTELTKYRVNTQTGQLVPAGVQVVYPGQTFTSPLQSAGKKLIQVRRHEDRDGYLVTAIGIEDGETLWETELAQPPAGEPVVSEQANRIALVLAGGAVFEMDVASLKERRVDNEPLLDEAFPDTSPRLGHRVDMQDRRALFLPERGRGPALLYDPTSDTPQQRLHWLSAPPAVACLPAAFGSGLLWPTTDGQVFYLSPETGKPLAQPFQPSLRPGSLPQWMTPSAAPGGKETFVISDTEGVSFLVGIAAEPTPHLRTLAATPDTVHPLEKGPTISADRVYVITADRHLITYQLPDLTPGPSVDLNDAVQWGPYAVGSGILLATESAELIRIDNGGQVVWRVPHRAGPLIGRPLVDEKHAVLASIDGTVIRVTLPTGERSGLRSLGQPLATGPVRLGSDIFVAGVDGTLLLVPTP
ncbi:MAG: PQQ-binding-like beta-propeller repeat protein, partial [Pirellulales bacterium]